MYGLKHLFTAHYQKPLLRSIPIRHYSAGINRRKRKWALQELSSSVITLTCESSAAGGVCIVHLVGSNHRSPDNWHEVQTAVKFLKPEVVFLELCSSRTDVLDLENLKAPTMRATMRKMVDLWKKNERPSWILYKGYRDMTYNFGCHSGGDFRAAYVEAKKYGAKVVLGDRPIDITEQRYWAKTSLLDLLVVYEMMLIPRDIMSRLTRKFDASAVNKSNQITAKERPDLAEIYTHERDLYLSAKLLEVARRHKSVVAVVGMAHVPGIQRSWKQPVDVEQLLTIPKEPITLNRVVGNILGVVGIVVDILKIIYHNIKRSGS